MRKRVVLLRSESERDHLLWVKALKAKSFPYEVEIIEVFREYEWSSLLNSLDDVVAIIARPSGLRQDFKRWFDERLMILSLKKQIIIYPSVTEVLIYENKKYLSDWLTLNKIPCPKTWIFYSLSELELFSNRCNLPVVVKTNIGASGKGVEIIKTRSDLLSYGSRAFSDGIVSKRGPSLFKGNLLKKIKKLFTIKNFISIRMKEYAQAYQEVQKGFVIVQEYVEHDFEWRCVIIGDSFFAHKKLRKGDKSSGTLLKEYSNPPESLLDFVYDISDKFDLNSVAIDLFVGDNKYMVNEIQCYFGQSDPHQMIVDNVPGRYRKINGNWIFEAGSFNEFESHGARVDHLAKLIQTRI